MDQRGKARVESAFLMLGVRFEGGSARIERLPSGRFIAGIGSALLRDLAPGTPEYTKRTRATFAEALAQFDSMGFNWRNALPVCVRREIELDLQRAWSGGRGPQRFPSFEAWLSAGEPGDYSVHAVRRSETRTLYVGARGGMYDLHDALSALSAVPAAADAHAAMMWRTIDADEEFDPTWFDGPNGVDAPGPNYFAVADASDEPDADALFEVARAPNAEAAFALAKQHKCELIAAVWLTDVVRAAPGTS